MFTLQYACFFLLALVIFFQYKLIKNTEKEVVKYRLALSKCQLLQTASEELN